jgi:DNA-binding PadR family transcriptional regulator
MLLLGSIYMNYPLRNLIYEKIKQAGTMMDSDLINALSKDTVSLNEGNLNKILLDLEIYGLIRVSWITKDKRRIEAVVDSTSV